MTEEERKYKIFQIFYHNTSSKELIQELKEEITKAKIINSASFKAMEDGIIANSMYHLIKENRKKYSEIMFYYNELLEKMKLLSKELNLENSLELCILFSYLLWNGYLSKNKKYEFNPENLRRIDGFYFTDIMNGNGVCLNNSDMLKDFLNINNFKSSILLNHYNTTTKINYTIDIKRNYIDKHESYMNKIITEIRTIKEANHVFNLIEENNELYIYDPTNLILQMILDPYSSKLINGTGKYRMFPYKSYMFCVQKEEIELLDKLITTDNYSSPYSKEDLISTSEIIIEIIQFSRTLLEDFYTEVRPNILSISEMTDKIKSRKRIR